MASKTTDLRKYLAPATTSAALSPKAPAGERKGIQSPLQKLVD